MAKIGYVTSDTRPSRFSACNIEKLGLRLMYWYMYVQCNFLVHKLWIASPSIYMYMSATPGPLRERSVPHHWRARRPLLFSQPLSSVHPTSLFSASSFNTSQFSCYALIHGRSYASVAQLEDRANSETDNPQAQSRYLEVKMTNLISSILVHVQVLLLLVLVFCAW